LKTEEQFTAFAGSERVAAGDPFGVAQVVKALMAARELRSILVFSDQTGRQVDIDLREVSAETFANRAASIAEPPPAIPEPRRRGRPKLGVVGREVTLLPRHWEWLNRQPGGASVVLRKLVEKARLDGRNTEGTRAAREATYHFATAIAGNEQGFEEACRALFAGNRQAFATQIQGWPEDVRDFATMLAVEAFGGDEFST
jgi:hypothetical protein